MPEFKDDLGFKDKMHLILKGPDGKIKAERMTDKEGQRWNKEEQDAKTK